MLKEYKFCFEWQIFSFIFIAFLHATKLERGKCEMLLAGRPFPYYERNISFLITVNFSNWLYIYIYILFFTLAIFTFKFYLLNKNNVINRVVLQINLSLNLRSSSHPVCQLPVLLNSLSSTPWRTQALHLCCASSKISSLHYALSSK
jgi:hypothetical protein